MRQTVEPRPRCDEGEEPGAAAFRDRRRAIPRHRTQRGKSRPLHPVPLDEARARRMAAATAIDAPPAVAPLRAAPPLIGRGREVGDLREALDAALAGAGRIVLLGGEPGIGKTRVASALADEAAARGVPTWSGRGWEDGSAPAFWPWNTALRRWIGQVGRRAAEDAAGPWRAELAHVFGVLRDPRDGGRAADAAESDGARFRLFDLVSRFLAAVAEPAGLVVVLDDLHWADQPSLKLLEFVAADLSDTRILVVATYRDTEVRRDSPLADALSRISREPAARRLAIGGLSTAECARWIELAGIAREPAALAVELHRETDGNPFFVGEIVQLLAAEHADRAARGERDAGLRDGAGMRRVPQSVRDVVTRRLDRLGDDCRATLGVAALLGDTIDTRMLASALGDAPHADHLDRALRDRILVAGESPGQMRFAHALIRRVVVDELPAAARAGWHARIAAALERQAGACDIATTEIVRHLAAAGTPEALQKAFDHACRGAEQAARGLGWEEAVRLWELALDVGRRCALLDARRAVELELQLARALRGAGDVPAARRRCQEVMATCRRIEDPIGFARAALIYAGPIPEWGRVEPPVRAVLQEACRVGPALDDGLRARLYGRLAGDLIAANEVEQEARVHSLCDEAAAAARRAGDDGALAVALTGTFYAVTMGMRRPALAGGSPDADARRPPTPTADEILAVADAGAEHELAAAVRHARAMGYLAFTVPAAFSAEVDDLATAAAASRAPGALWSADAMLALRASVQGRFAEAHDAMERALATGRRMQLPNAVGVHMSQRIMWHALRGRLGEIGPEIDAFVEEHPGGAGWRPLRALARLARGDVAAARAEMHAMLARGLAPAERGAMARCYLAGLAALCVALRDAGAAPELYRRISRRCDAWSVDGFHTLGPWALLLGALARLCGRPLDAAAHLEGAIEIARRMESRPLVARAQSMLASVRLSLDPDAAERARIAAMLDEAGRCAQELEIVDVAARVARLRPKLATAAPAPAESDGANVFSCEGDVWTVRFRGRAVRLRDGKGPRYLAALLAAPGREFHVLELASPAPARPPVAAAAQGLTIGGGGAIEDAPDARARREYRARVEELRAEIDEADELCDLGRAERARAELEVLVAQLAQTFGSHARTRGPSETARKAVTKVLRTQIGKILAAHAPLGEHLRDCLHMGTFCAYAPPTPVEWEVGFRPE